MTNIFTVVYRVLCIVNGYSEIDGKTSKLFITVCENIFYSHAVPNFRTYFARKSVYTYIEYVRLI